MVHGPYYQQYAITYVLNGGKGKVWGLRLKAKGILVLTHFEKQAVKLSLSKLIV
jgi:hypothetical protein